MNAGRQASLHWAAKLATANLDAYRMSLGQAYAKITVAIERIAGGGMPDAQEDALLEVFRRAGGQPVHTTSPFRGDPVERTGRWHDDMDYFDPLPACDSGPLTALAVEQRRPSQPASILHHSHPGEEFVVVLEGSLEFDWLIPITHEGSFESIRGTVGDEEELAATTWFRSGMPHRAVPVGPCSRYIAFYSHPQGAHRLFSRSVPQSNARKQKVGLDTTKISNQSPAEVETLLWGLGHELRSTRLRRGETLEHFGELLDLDQASLSRIENHKKLPDLLTMLSAAVSLDRAAMDLLPISSVKPVQGCYLRRSSSVSYLFQDTPVSELPDRLLVPFEWIDGAGLFVFPTGSPYARSLLPLLLYIADTPTEHWPKPLGVVASQNAVRLRQSRAPMSIPHEVFALVLEGAAEFQVSRFPFMHLMPRFALNDEDWAFEKISAPAGSLTYLPQSPFSFRLRAASTRASEPYCKVLLVTRAPTNVSASLRVPIARWSSPSPIVRTSLRGSEQDIWGMCPLGSETL